LSDLGLWTTLGDKVLVQVTTAVIYGIAQPATFAFQPLGGFSEELVATALVLVRHP